MRHLENARKKEAYIIFGIKSIDNIYGWLFKGFK